MQSTKWIGVFLILGFLMRPCLSQEIVQPSAYPRGLIDLSGRFHGLTQGYGDWWGVYANAAHEISSMTTVRAEISGHRRYGDGGLFLGLGVTQTLSPKWYITADLATSVGGFYLLSFRQESSIHRKWFDSENLVTKFGIAYYVSKDAHRDFGPLLSATYYFDPLWIFELGVRFILSTPGEVLSYSGYGVLIHTKPKGYSLSFRAGFAREAYQLIQPSTVVVDFNSIEASTEGRVWLGPDWGGRLGFEVYSSSFYKRIGVLIGAFQEY